MGDRHAGNGMLRGLTIVALAAVLGACAQPEAEDASGSTGVGQDVPAEGAATLSADASGGTAARTGASRVGADTFVDVVIGEPESLDPAWTYESQGIGIDLNVYEGLLGFEREKADAFVPALASEWDVSEDGLEYTFRIRDGVTFHEGGSLEPHDVAYSWHRTMLQDRGGGPSWLLLSPLVGANTMSELAAREADLEIGDDGPPELEDIPTEALIGACETVKAAVVADDAAGTVRIRVLEPTPWLPQLAAQWIGAVLDSEWMAEQGDWDGDCGTWTDFHDPAAEETVIYDRANGTGPYRLIEWAKNDAIRLTANDAYWREEPAWPGGPSGTPRIKNVVMQKVEEWGTRFAKLQGGEADRVDVPLTEIDQVTDLVYTEYAGGDESAPATVVSEDGSLKLFTGYPVMSMDAATFNQAVEVAGGNPFIGSGALDGEGIPPDFFSDVHVRRAFNYCFDSDTYIEDALQGNGIRPRGPIPTGLQGYRDDSLVYPFDLEKCEEELALAWDGVLPETGFKLTVAYNEGATERQAAAEILADGLSQVNPAYRIEIVQQQWPTLLENMNGHRLPIAFVGWAEDYHDASNWAYAFMHSQGWYGSMMALDEDLAATIDGLIDQATNENDPAVRDELFAEVQQTAMEEAVGLFLHEWRGRTYMDRGVSGWFAHPLISVDRQYYQLSKEAQ